LTNNSWIAKFKILGVLDMDENTLNQMKQQHIDNYRKAVIDIIENNTNALVEDIKTVLKKPPLEAMDLIKVKLLSLAKKNKVILNTEKLDKILTDFRKSLFDMCILIYKVRTEELNSKINNTVLDSTDVILKINKKDFNEINKEIKSIIKSTFSSASDNLIGQIDSVFSADDDIKNKILVEITKYIKNNYLKQLIDGCDIKILVKDTTLINSVKEQAERYKFTLSNSRILNDLDN